MPIRQDPITANITASLTTAFQRTVSNNRWATYLQAAGHDASRALSMYLWNAALGQSFHFPIQATEVALRNVTNDVLCDRFGLNWPTDNACRAALGQDRTADIDKAIKRLKKKYRATPHTDQIVASLTLGFWAALLHRKYHNSVWAGYEPDAFPNLPASKSIGDVSAAANQIQDLRNRIAHHEPLIGRNLSGDYGVMLDMIAWICDETSRWVRSTASVPAVIRLKP